MSNTPQDGDVWDYPYLWAWQQERGETEGRKHRPCAVAIRTARRKGETVGYLLALTTKRPQNGRECLEVPQTELRRVNLDQGINCWIVLDEYNADILETSYYLEPDAWIGAFSPRFLKQIRTEFLRVLKKKGAQSVGRMK